jgi:hypothetical protein
MLLFVPSVPTIFFTQEIHTYTEAYSEGIGVSVLFAQNVLMYFGFGASIYLLNIKTHLPGKTIAIIK